LNDSVGSLAGVDSGAAVVGAFGSGVFELEVIELDIRGYSACGVIPP
jgi:hypothetical protein